MKKNKSSRKAIAVLMTLVMSFTMVFATAATSFAATDDTINVTVEFAYDDEYLTEDMNYDTSTFERTEYTIPANPGTAVITGNTPTVMDATLGALTKLNKRDGVIAGWDTGAIGGMYITKMLGKQTETAADSSATVWRGYAWKYLVNGEEAGLYATNIALKNGDVITWIYDYCEEAID